MYIRESTNSRTKIFTIRVSVYFQLTSKEALILYQAPTLNFWFRVIPYITLILLIWAKLADINLI